MKFFSIGSAFIACILAIEISPISAEPASCSASSVTSCTDAIKSTKTRTLSLTSWCSSVLGCVQSTTTLTGDPVTITSTKVVWESFSYEVLASEDWVTSSYTYTETEYSAVETTTLTPTWTVERFVVTTVKPRARRWEEAGHVKDILKRQKTTSICPSAIETQACSCILTGCAPPITKDARSTIKEKITETSYSAIEIPITYTNVEWTGTSTTEIEEYTETATVGVLSTHTTTIKCTPSSTNPSFYLQATDAPAINGQYWWAAPTNPRLLSFSVEVAFNPDIAEATVFSLDSANRLITRHKGGTLYANVDPYASFSIVHHLTRENMQLRKYNYLRCEIKPPSGRYPGGYGELYCLADGPFNRGIFNWCPIYLEWFNSPLVISNRWSDKTPPCAPVVFLIKPVCEGV
ncbi:hypothetical protein TWF679_000987 [Orbilia oligospora]|uniref:Flo11 domain-containing protein n=2 Tax=Orbilia oligospora TaxID=2813651 RepID=A0A8H8VHS3_ORBOL|nr:hypothetical protein TWF679_000987 [Orbilia oligospora]